MKHLDNIYDPRLPDAEMLLEQSYEDWIRGPVGMRQAWLSHLEWVQSHVIGPPQATPHYTVAELQSQGYIGIYQQELEPISALSP